MERHPPAPPPPDPATPRKQEPAARTRLASLQNGPARRFHSPAASGPMPLSEALAARRYATRPWWRKLADALTERVPSTLHGRWGLGARAVVALACLAVLGAAVGGWYLSRSEGTVVLLPGGDGREGGGGGKEAEAAAAAGTDATAGSSDAASPGTAATARSSEAAASTAATAGSNEAVSPGTAATGGGVVRPGMAGTSVGLGTSGGAGGAEPGAVGPGVDAGGARPGAAGPGLDAGGVAGSACDARTGWPPGGERWGHTAGGDSAGGRRVEPTGESRGHMPGGDGAGSRRVGLASWGARSTSSTGAERPSTTGGIAANGSLSGGLGGERLNPARALDALSVGEHAASSFSAATTNLLDGAPKPACPTHQPPRTATVVVDVEGKVAHPGIQTLPSGARVYEALKAAGDVLPGADATGLDLARPLVDGEQLRVGLSGVPSPPVGVQGPSNGGARGKRGKPVQPVNLNTATLEELEAVPDVGPALAQRIVEWREQHGRFASVAQLRQVRGIGERKFADMRDSVTV